MFEYEDNMFKKKANIYGSNDYEIFGGTVDIDNDYIIASSNTNDYQAKIMNRNVIHFKYNWGVEKQLYGGGKSDNHFSPPKVSILNKKALIYTSKNSKDVTPYLYKKEETGSWDLIENIPDIKWYNVSTSNSGDLSISDICLDYNSNIIGIPNATRYRYSYTTNAGVSYYFNHNHTNAKSLHNLGSDSREDPWGYCELKSDYSNWESYKQCLKSKMESMNFGKSVSSHWGNMIVGFDDEDNHGMAYIHMEGDKYPIHGNLCTLDMDFTNFIKKEGKYPDVIAGKINIGGSVHRSIYLPNSEQNYIAKSIVIKDGTHIQKGSKISLKAISDCEPYSNPSLKAGTNNSSVLLDEDLVIESYKINTNLYAIQGNEVGTQLQAKILDGNKDVFESIDFALQSVHFDISGISTDTFFIRVYRGEEIIYETEYQIQ